VLRHDIVDAIGDTPLVRLRTGADRGVAVYAKLEMHNPYAMKDRVAKQVVLAARRDGLLADGAPIIESSSGTLALGLAFVGTALGHPVHIVTDPRIDRLTLAKLRALGARVHVVPAMDAHGWQGARLTRLRALMAEHDDAFWPRQYENPENPAAYLALAEELTADLDRIDVLVGAVGSGGSLCGTARVLRKANPDLHVVGVDCVGSVLFGQPDRPRRLQSGLGNSLHPPNLDHDQIDEVHWLGDHEAFAATRDLVRVEKLFAGNTSGSVFRVLGELARRSAPGTTVVGIFPDRGDRYVDTVYDDEHWVEHGLPARPIAERPRRVLPGTVVDSWSYVRHDADAPPPALLFVESNTTGTGMRALILARDKGFEPVFLTDTPARYVGLDETGATVVVCATDDPESLRAAAEPYRGRLAGVTTTSEFALVAAAGLAVTLGLPAEPPETVAGCRDKATVRRLLAKAGVPQPRSEVVRDAAEARDAVVAVGLPCVVKPVSESGSTNVLRCDDLTAARAHVDRVLAVRTNVRGQPVPRAVLVEEYLDGPEFSVEMFGVDGAQTLLGVVGKSVGAAPHFVERQHVFPADLPTDVVESLSSTVRAALDAVGLRRGPSHTEVRLTPAGPRIVEINPRLAGGMIPELFRLTTGTDLLAAQLDLATGREPEVDCVPDGCAAIRFLTAPRPGVLAEVDGLDQARALPGVTRVTVTAQVGDRVAPPTDAYGRLGYVIARGASRTEVLASLDAADAAIVITTSAE
jgi:cysteine synthase/biotin carboxylase